MLTQENDFWSVRVAAATLATFLALGPVAAGEISHNSDPDPILSGDGKPAPCRQGAAYVAGIDADGNPVAPAETESPDILGDRHALVTVPSQGRQGGDVTVDVDLAKLAPPTCHHR